MNRTTKIICATLAALEFLTVGVVVVVLFSQPLVRSYRTGLSKWQVEYQYEDCWVTEKYVLQSRDFEALYPKKSSTEAVQKWNREHADEMTEEIPEAAYIIRDDAKPVLPEVFNETNKGTEK